MAKKELVDFLKQAQKLKLNLELMGRELVKTGWQIRDVDEAIEIVKPLKVPKAPMPPAPPKDIAQQSASEEMKKAAAELIEKLRGKGLKDEQIKAEFMKKGWKEEAIDELIAE
jgi:hypothetical protein